MEKKRVYLETTVVSYLTARPSRDVVVAGKQEITRQWWQKRKDDFHLYVSQIVADEAGKGDPDAVKRRRAVLVGVPRLDVIDAVVELAEELVAQDAVPKSKPEDALHIALAAVHGMDFLITWNCSHIANAERMETIESVIEACGYYSPRICTPDELLGETPWKTQS